VALSHWRQRLELLQSRSSRRKQVPVHLAPYKPVNDKAMAFHTSPALIKHISGGNRAGKTETLIYDDLCLMRDHPGCNIVISTVTNDMIGRIIWPKIQKYLAHEYGRVTAWINKSRKIPYTIEMINGSTAYCISYEQGAEKLQGISVDRVHMDEESKKQEFYDEALLRVLDTGGDIVMSMTPLRGLTWVYDEIIEKAATDSDIETWTFTLLENKFIPQWKKDRIIARLSQAEYDKRVLGLWVRLTGAVFVEFDPRIHVIDPFPIPAVWRKYRVIDFGFTNPFVCLWAAVDPADNTIYVYQEYYEREITVDVHAKNILARNMQGLSNDTTYFQCRGTIADHDAEGRAMLNKCGIPTIAAKKDNQEQNIDIANRCFKVNRDGKAGQYIFRTCTNTVSELRKWHYVEGTDKHDAKEKPIDKDDHTCDCKLYLDAHVAPLRAKDPFSGFLGGDALDNPV
jgi:PBSX family phage terminase large subunit